VKSQNLKNPDGFIIKQSEKHAHTWMRLVVNRAFLRLNCAVGKRNVPV